MSKRIQLKQKIRAIADATASARSAASNPIEAILLATVEFEYTKAFLRHPMSEQILLKTLERSASEKILEQHLREGFSSCLAEVEGRISIVLQQSGQTKHKTIVQPPGCNMLALADFFLSKKSFSTVCLPSVSDMREEYFEALSQNRIWKARWVRIRGTYSFFAAIGLDWVFAFVSFFVKVWKSVN